MITVEHSIEINRPVDEVFAFAGTGHIKGHKQWAPALIDIRQTSAGPMGVGTTYHQVRNINGKPTDIDTEVTAFEPNKRLSFKNQGGIPAQGTYSFEPSGAGTKVTFRLEMEPSGFGRLAGPMIGRAVKKETQDEMERLKSVLESGAAVPA